MTTVWRGGLGGDVARGVRQDPCDALLGVATLAHDLEGPLGAIAAALERMRRTCREPEALSAAAAIEEQVRRARRYVADAEAWATGASPSAGAATALDLVGLVREAVEACAPTAETSRCRLAFDDPGDAELTVAGDRDRLGDAVREVVHNACKFTGARGMVRVRVRAVPGDDRAEVEVSDTGQGLAPADRQRLFTPFFRTSAARARDPQGRGLGLTIAARTIELHGGDVHVASEGPGRGTLVRVRLPLARPPRAPEAAPARPARRVLVVEDWAELGEVFGELLRGRGLDVHVVLDGASALGLAPRLRPDLVFMDLGLPDMPGADVGRQLRASHPDAVLVALTGRSDQGEAVRCMAAGFDHYVLKPIDGATLDEVLEMVERRKTKS